MHHKFLLEKSILQYGKSTSVAVCAQKTFAVNRYMHAVECATAAPIGQLRVD